MVRTAVTTEPFEVAPPVVGVTVVGASMQVESTGAPVQLRATGVV